MTILIPRRYNFHDEFSSVLPSASLNNSNCEPGPGARTAVDTETCMSIIPNYGSSLADQTGVTFGGSNNRCSYADNYSWFDFPTGFNAADHAGLGRIVVMYDSAGRAAWGFIGAAGTGETTTEKIIDPGFDDATKWTATSGWSISSSLATEAGGLSYLIQTSPINLIKRLVRSRAVLSAYTSGNWQFLFDGGAFNSANQSTTPGTIDYYRVCSSNDSNGMKASGVSYYSFSSFSLVTIDSPSATGVLIYRDAACTVNGWHKPAAFNMNDTAYTFNIYQPTSGGRLFVQGGKATAAYGDPGLWDTTAITRAAGLICAFRVNPKDISKVLSVGLDTDKTSTLDANGIRITGSTVVPYDNASAGPAVAIPTNATEHILAIILRAAGANYFMKSGTGNFKRLWSTQTNNTATLYRGISGYSLTGKVDFIRQPKTLWLPTPLLSDSFTGDAGSNDGRLSDGLGHAETTGLGSGGSGVAWSGASGAVDGSGRLVITPTLGSELLIDGGMENWTTTTNLTNWAESPYGSSTVNRESSDKYAGNYACRIDVDSSNSEIYVAAGAISTLGWYLTTGFFKSSVDSKSIKFGPNNYLRTVTLNTSYIKYSTVSRVPTTTNIIVERGTAASASLYIDNVSCKQINLSTCFTTASLPTKDITLKSAFQMQTGLQCGVVLGLSADGNSFIIAYHDGSGNIKLEICEAGTYTTKATVAAAYSSDSELVVRRDNKEIWVWYNNTLIGSGPTTTLSDGENTNLAGLKAGLFSTSELNSFAYATIYNTGTNNEYSILDSLIGRDTVDAYYGLTWDESTDTYIRLGLAAGLPLGSSPGDSKLPIHAQMRRCVVNDSGVIQYFLDPIDSTKKADGTASKLDGTDGQVMVYVPAFYTRYMYGDYGTTSHSWMISSSPLDGFTLHPAFNVNGIPCSYRLYGAYEGYKDGSNKLCSISGVLPTGSKTRATFRGYATNRGPGWGIEDAYLVAAVQLLYLIEFADFDSQSVIGAGITAYAAWPTAPQALCGNSNSIGNATGNVSASVPKWAATTAKSLGNEIIPLATQNGYTYRCITAGTTGSTEPTLPTTIGNTVADGTVVWECVRINQYMSYRGIENWYGHIWKFVDGINVNNVTGTGSQLYVCNTKAHFADNTETNYSLFGLLAQSNGYGKTLIQAANGFYPNSVGGGSTTYLADYYYTAFGTDGWRVDRRGGHASSGAYAGAFYWLSDITSSIASSDIGGRLCF